MKDLKEYVDKQVVIVYKENSNTDTKSVKCKIAGVDENFIHLEGLNGRNSSIHRNLILVIKEDIYHEN